MNDKEFFNTISEFYDGMINFPTALGMRKLFDANYLGSRELTEFISSESKDLFVILKTIV